jgi:hypothetical protein
LMLHRKWQWKPLWSSLLKACSDKEGLWSTSLLIMMFIQMGFQSLFANGASLHSYLQLLANWIITTCCKTDWLRMKWPIWQWQLLLLTT